MIEYTKQCRKCNTDKPIDEYSKRETRCKQCVNLNRKKNYYANINRERSKCHKWHKEHTKERAETKRFKQYGLTFDNVQQMYISQNGQCAICEHRFKSRSDFVIDHNHSTGQVRQLLCNHCNTALGLLKENIRTIEHVIAYLNKWNNN